MPILVFDIRGMTCGGCSYKVQHALGRLDGISHSEVTLVPPLATVTMDLTKATPGQVESVINEAGFAASLRPATDPPAADSRID